MPCDAECAEALREVRWALGLLCLYCGSLRLRKNLYLTASTMKLRGIVELEEVYVTTGFKGKKQ